MGDVFAIVSKAVFEKEAGVELGEVWPVARYTGGAKVFETTLEDGGRIIMVTVRPPDEQLWLVAVLEDPEFDAKQKAWVAKPNAVPVTDITALRKTLAFASGKGMSQDKGTLGMSLQTPRALGDGDAEKLAALIGGGGKRGGGGGGKAPVAAKTAEAPAAPGKKSTRSTDRIAALLGAIRDAPEDAANREVLADTYEAGGDPARAEVIRSQVQRHDMDGWDPRAVALEIAERDLRREHEANWLAELKPPKGVKYGGLDRGVFAWASFDDCALVGKHLAAVMDAHPITGVMTRWPRRGARPKLAATPGLKKLVIIGTLLQEADIAWLAKSPFLSTIETLTLQNSRMDDDALAALLASPYLTKLRHLRLPFHQLSNAGVAQFAEASLPQLVELDLAVETSDAIGSGGRDGMGISAEGIHALVGWDQMAKIESIDLTGCQITAEGVKALLGSKNSKRLKTVVLRSISDYDVENDDFPDALVGLEGAKGCALDHLDIGENQLSDDAAAALRTSPVFEKLKTFDCDYQSSDPLGKVFSEAKWVNGVHMMSLTDSNTSAIKKLIEREPKALHTLELASGYPRSNLKGIVNTLAANKLKALQSLDLYGSTIDDAALKKLGAANKSLPALIGLRLGRNKESSYSDDEDDGNPYSDEAAKAFVGSPLGKQLRSVIVDVEGVDFGKPIKAFWLDSGNDDDDDDDEGDDE